MCCVLRAIRRAFVHFTRVSRATKALSVRRRYRRYVQVGLRELGRDILPLRRVSVVGLDFRVIHPNRTGFGPKLFRTIS